MIAIVDTLAKEIVGPISTFRHDQPAIRMFAEVMGYEQYRSHITDFSLVHIADIIDDLNQIDERTLVEMPRTIITGDTLLAAQEKKNQ